MPKWSRRFGGKKGRIFPLFPLPPYFPQLNPIERLWKWLKGAAIAHICRKDRNDIMQASLRLSTASTNVRRKCCSA
ncbi:transposase [Geobacillus sp. 46C-IIa]|uniref:transposase n=1 Tax=Geobacillus sp. 46C-IIa TaxID=1963025 RepID=UPI003511CC93